MYIQTYNQYDVVEAANKRVSFIFNNFENIIVSISGGKDSTVCAWLMLNEAHKRGRKIGLFFLDEEVVYDSTIKQIEWLMNLYPDNTMPYWLQIDFNLTNSTSLSEGQLRCWETGKHEIWMRPKVDCSIKYRIWDKSQETVRDKNKGFGFYDVIENFERCFANTAFVVGLRATESPNRWRAMVKNPVCVNGKAIFWATKKEHGSCSMYPIYDWNFSDVWRFIHENKIRYSKIYDYQFLKGVPTNEIRVSSLIHEKSFKSICTLPEYEPKTYEKLSQRIQGIIFAQETGKDKKVFRARKLPKNYKSWITYRDFLLETYPDEGKKHIFVDRFKRYINNEYVARQECRQLILNDYENDLPIRNGLDPREEKLNYYRSAL